MSEESLSLSFSDSSADSSSDSSSENIRFVHLEQFREREDYTESVTLSALNQMISRAKSGISAFTILADQDCSYSISGNIFTTWFHFYVWPSKPDLEHTLSASAGYISNGTVARNLTEFSILFESTDTVTLDFMLEESFTYYFETSKFTADGKAIYTKIDIEIENYTVLRASEKFFGVVRIRGYKIGTKHKLTTTLTPSLTESDNSSPKDSYKVTIKASTADFNIDEYPPELGEAPKEQQWKLEFINSSVYNVFDEAGISVTSGPITEDTTAGNYFTIKSDMFSDVVDAYEEGDYLIFETEYIDEDKLKSNDVVEIEDHISQTIEIPEDSHTDLTGYKIENLKITITATWKDIHGDDDSESLLLEVPQCVQDALDMCGSSFDISGITTIVNGPVSISGDDDDDDGKKSAIVYFSVCDGSILKVVEY